MGVDNASYINISLFSNHIGNGAEGHTDPGLSESPLSKSDVLSELHVNLSLSLSLAFYIYIYIY